MFFPLSKALWSIAGPATRTAVLLGAAFAVRRRRALALTLVLVACATMGALTLPPIANALERVVAASGRTTIQPGIEYDVAIVLGGNRSGSWPPPTSSGPAERGTCSTPAC